ncbi:hypothetical protein TVAG_400200 [Trichomonas vaginalis G3]|uniref:DnaK protein n=1 Tax=Trichomonas vaginalis (strain ATCC PRA-98 / G3) TaxID=412133 RepID=A2F7E2_TRIV3|nr:ATP binding [Trichomonas vaginalis G3]EAX99158.1 hypothetical protein TVAG_400200 [Trichomonas vaginalis G3]KAI5552166.1 ATP binding [Trichomonas vaginalis G3]|eukprot:XP_001312088.1 hypothetical protein [Trichomonas vaginalis G3]
MMFLGFLLLIQDSHIIAIDIGVDGFRVALPSKDDNVLIISSPECKGLFPTTLEISPIKGNIPKTINHSNIHNLRFKFLSPKDHIKNPNSTILHPTNFLCRLSSPEFMQQTYKRKYLHRKSLYLNSYHVTSGLLPQIVTSTVLARIKSAFDQNEFDIGKTIITVPKFWVQNQRETIYHPAKKLNLHPTIIDSSSAIGAHLARKYRTFLSKFPHRILAIEIGISSCESTIFEFTRKETLFAHELSYYWTDQAGTRDFDCAVADLLQKITKTPLDPENEILRLEEAKTIQKLLRKNETVSGYYNGIPYKITRNQVKSVCEEYFKKILHMIDRQFLIVPNIEIDLVEIIGSGAKHFAIYDLLKNVFGENRIKIDHHPKDYIAIGACVMPIQNVSIDYSPLYPTELIQDKNRVLFVGFKWVNPFKSGTVQVGVPVEHRVPIGVPHIYLWGQVTENTVFRRNPSQILKLKDSNRKVNIPWLEETLRTTQYIVNFVDERDKTRNFYENSSSFFDEIIDDIRDGEDLCVVMHQLERDEIVEKLLEIKRKFRSRTDFTMNEIDKMIHEAYDVYSPPKKRLENRLTILKMIDKYYSRIYSILEELSASLSSIKTIKLNNPLVEELLRPAAEFQLWLDEKMNAFYTSDPTTCPNLWWFDIEKKLDDLEALYKTKVKRLRETYQ